jgi:hypothetical protein
VCVCMHVCAHTHIAYRGVCLREGREQKNDRNSSTHTPQTISVKKNSVNKLFFFKFFFFLLILFEFLGSVKPQLTAQNNFLSFSSELAKKSVYFFLLFFRFTFLY